MTNRVGNAFRAVSARSRVEEALHRIAKNGGDQNGEIELIDELAQVMRDASICGLGHTAASAVQSALSRNLLLEIF